MTVQGDFSKLSEASFSTEVENLTEEEFELFAVIFAKVTDGAEVRLLVRSEKAEGDVTLEQAI